MLGSNKKMADSVLRVARVIKSKPHENAMDIVYLDDGVSAFSVPVMSQHAGYSHGTHYLPDPRPKNGEGGAMDVDLGLDKAGDKDMLAVVANLMSNPIILGFMYPDITHNAFDYDKFPDIRVDRHASDFEMVTMGTGAFELRHPSGTSIEIGSVPSLAGADFNQKYKHKRNLRNKMPVTLRVKTQSGDAVINIEANGKININSPSQVSINTIGNIYVAAKGELKVSAVGKLSLDGGVVDITAKGALTLTGNPVLQN
jgi:hypothetical protein